MAEDYQNEDVKKVTVEIEKSLYLFVTGQLYFGQLSKIIRTIFESIRILILQGKIKDVILFASGEDDLTLPRVVRDKE